MIVKGLIQPNRCHLGMRLNGCLRDLLTIKSCSSTLEDERVSPVELIEAQFDLGCVWLSIAAFAAKDFFDAANAEGLWSIQV